MVQVIRLPPGKQDELYIIQIVQITQIIHMKKASVVHDLGHYVCIGDVFDVVWMNDLDHYVCIGDLSGV